MAGRELLTLSLYSLFASNRSGLFLVYFPIYLVTVRGAPVSVALALVSTAYVASSVLGPVVGRWSDRIGRRKPFLLAGEAGALPLYIAIALLPTYWTAGAAFIAAQAVLAIGSPALNAYVTDLTRERERGRGFGLLNATGFVGQMVGFVVVAVLVGPFGISVLFPFVVGVMIGSLAIVVFLVPDRRVPTPVHQLSWAEARPLVTFSVTVSIRSLGMGAVGTFFGVYAGELGATESEVAIVALAGLVTAALVSVPFGRLVDRFGELRGIWYGTLLSLGGIVLFLFAPTWIVLVPGQSLRLMGVALLNPALLAWVSNLAPPGHRAEYLGIFGLVNSTLWSLGPLGGGLALDVGGNLGLFLFAVGTTVVSIVAIELLYLTRPPARSVAAPPEARLSPEMGPAAYARSEPLHPSAAGPI